MTASITWSSWPGRTEAARSAQASSSHSRGERDGLGLSGGSARCGSGKLVALCAVATRKSSTEPMASAPFALFSRAMSRSVLVRDWRVGSPHPRAFRCSLARRTNAEGNPRPFCGPGSSGCVTRGCVIGVCSAGCFAFGELVLEALGDVVYVVGVRRFDRLDHLGRRLVPFSFEGFLR